MRNDVLVYLSGPIAPKNGRSTAQHAMAASAAFYELLQAGVPSFLPHVFCFAVHLDAVVDYETWMAYDLAVVGFCTHMLMLPHWEESSGAVREREHALRAGIPVLTSPAELMAALGHPASAI